MLEPRVRACLFLAALLALACGAAEGDGNLAEVEGRALGRHLALAYPGSLETVLERRYLRVLTSRNGFDYFIHEGRHGGYQYEMVKAFAEHLSRKYASAGKPRIRFELLPVRSEQLIPMLLDGRGDMVAARLTVTPTRKDRVRFSIPYRRVDEVIVTRRRPDDYRLPRDLSGETIAVRRSSSYYESLVELNRALERDGHAPVEIATVDEQLETENILELVAAGHFEFTVADSLVAEAAVAIHPELSILRGLELRRGGELAWATRPGAARLLEEIDAFLPRYRHGSLLGNVGVNRYFADYRGLKARLATDPSDGLSPYDAYIRRYSAEFGFDWRLMAAVAYQESRFRQSSLSPSGAIGLFQIKPATAREPYVGISDIAGEKNAANNVRAGIKYLAWIKSRYFDAIPGMREPDRVRMALAAYNAGPRTLLDARVQAREMGLDPARWSRHVELALLAMNRPEPVKYVSEINRHYLSYILLGFE